MASITDNSKKYGEGHQVILKDRTKLSSSVLNLYAANGYQAGKSIFSIALNPSGVSNIIQYSTTGSLKTVYVKDSNNNIVQLIGSASAINNTFNHYSTNAKSNTNLLTEVKENISMWIFEGWFTSNKILSENDIADKLGNNKKYYQTNYYESSLKQLKELKKYFPTGRHQYDYERQGGKHTAKLYKVARSLTSKAADNWNPADVWMIRSGFDMTPLYESTNFKQLNGLLAEGFQKKDIIPISLKNVTSQNATSSVIDPKKLLAQKIDIDLSFEKVDLSNTFANFIVQTKSGFAVRAGFKASATTLSVSLEGRMINAGYQLGAIDASDYRKEMTTVHNYTLRSGSVSDNDKDKAKKELKEIILKYPRFSNTITDYDQAIQILNTGDKLTQDRFCNLVSYMYGILVAPTDFEAHMKYCYFMSKKITDKSGLYLILQ
jgi:hypothetical protein